jgi:uncharacterized membrane protein YgaE (UPF0421/DUF939 family)
MARQPGNRSGYRRIAGWLDRSQAQLRLRWRATLRQSWRRTAAAGVISAQGAVAAALAWLVAAQLLHHPRPFFAPVAAIIVLDVSEARRLLRAVQLVLGVALGIAIGDALIYEIGTGAWQVGLVVFLATMLAVFLTGNPTFVAQASASAVLIATLNPPRGGGIYLTRFVDALIGGGIAVVVTALLLPADPLTAVARRAGPACQALADGLTRTGQALSARDARAAEEALRQLEESRGTLSAFRESLPEGTETANVAPIRRRARGVLARYGEVAQHLERSLGNAQVLARRSVTLIRDEEPVPEHLPRSVHTLAEATQEVCRALADPAVDHRVAELSLRAVSEAAEAYEAGLNFSGSTVVAQIRAIATDLLSAGRLPHGRANEMVREAGGNPARP